MEYPREFVGRRPLHYHINWFQSDNNIEEAVDDDDTFDDLKPPASKCPKVVPGCN
jgi:hypothetical protein